MSLFVGVALKHRRLILYYCCKHSYDSNGIMLFQRIVCFIANNVSSTGYGLKENNSVEIPRSVI